MKARSIMLRRLAAGFAGLLYAALYGLFTMLATGGGHGNFVWFLSFVFIEFFGIYFPIMMVLAVDLGSKFTKIIFGSLIIFNVGGSLLMLWGWISGKSLDDFDKTWAIASDSILICCVSCISCPQDFFLSAILVGEARPDDDSVVTLGLS